MGITDFQELKTSRLVLRRCCREDAGMYFARLASSEAVTRYMLFSPHQCPEESLASVEKSLKRYETGEALRWVLDLPGEGLIGVIDLLRFDWETGSCSFAYMLAEKFWGRGFGTEALRAVFGYAFENLGIWQIEADHMAENPASGAVMRKAGMTYVRTDIAKYEKNGIVQDAHVYRITRQEWEAREENAK